MCLMNMNGDNLCTLNAREADRYKKIIQEIEKLISSQDCDQDDPTNKKIWKLLFTPTGRSKLLQNLT